MAPRSKPKNPRSPKNPQPHQQDAGNQDAGNQDAGKQDAGKQDAGKQDAGKQDAGKQDAGKQDVDKLTSKRYEAELLQLQIELIKVQEWVRTSGARLVVLIEGRDAAGKGGTIRRVTEYLNPRIARVVALPAPTERERTQWYFQRYIPHLPATGEIVVFDRSWYDRAGVEKVMGFCTPAEYARFMRQAPVFEQMLIDDGVLLRKYWFSVSDAEQLRRFRSRQQDPVRRWKLSPMDVESINRWEDYSRAKDEMMAYTDLRGSPWYDVESDSKKRARLNMIAHLLSTIPYAEVTVPEVEVPDRPAASRSYERPPRNLVTQVPDHVAELLRGPVPAAE